MKIKLSLLFVCLLLLGGYQTVNNVLGTPIRIKEHISNAQKYEKKEIYEDALEEYKAAVQLGEEDISIKRKIAEMQLKLDDTSAFVTACESLIDGKDMDEESLQMLVDYYDSEGKKTSIVELLKSLRKKVTDNKTVEKLWKQYRGYYEESYFSYDEVSPFYQGYSIVKNENCFGLADSKGEIVIPIVYETMGFFSKDYSVASVCENGNWYYLNTKVHKKIVPDEAYDFLGVISEDTVLVGKDGKYGFADTEIVPKTELEWDGASNLYQGIAAVKQNGKWGLLDDSFQTVTEYQYEDIAVNEAGFCSGQERVFAKTKKGYQMLNKKGKKVGQELYEDARPFETDELAAVKQGGKWGFVNTSGELVIQCQYEDAHSFTQETAAVKKNGKWGYINVSNEMIVEPVFEDAYPFNEAGMAPVKNENWYFIYLPAIA